MRIIKRGTPPGDKVATFSCNNCKTEYEAKKSEGKEVHDQRDGDFVEFKCMVCHQRITVDSKLFKDPKPTQRNPFYDR